MSLLGLLSDNVLQDSHLLKALPHSEQEKYLSDLLNSGLDRLKTEPERLKTECQEYKKQNIEKAVENYETFLSGASCAEVVHHQLQRCHTAVTSLTAHLPQLERACSQVTQSAQATKERRERNQLTLSLHNQLLELLELPQLMDSCVRNEFYEEALDLSFFTQQLVTAHRGVAVVATLAAEVAASERQMIVQLVHKLQSNIQLPVCLHIIGLFRRMGKFSDSDIRRTFIHCRDKWLRDSIATIPRSSKYGYLKKYTDLLRVNLFEVITQYHAIFVDESSKTSSSNTATSSASSSSGDKSLLHCWGMSQIAAFHSALAHTLPQLTEGSSLASMLDQTMHCGAYLGRVGLDFRGLLVPLFESAVRRLFTANLSQATTTFERSLNNYHFIPPSTALQKRFDETKHSLSAPAELLDFPPIAIFSNKVLEAMNELRECAPLSLREACWTELNTCVSAMAETLVGVVNSNKVFGDVETAHLKRCCEITANVAAPYLLAALSKIYGPYPKDLGFAVRMLKPKIESEDVEHKHLNGVAAVKSSSTSSVNDDTDDDDEQERVTVSDNNNGAEEEGSTPMESQLSENMVSLDVTPRDKILSTMDAADDNNDNDNGNEIAVTPQVMQEEETKQEEQEEQEEIKQEEIPQVDNSNEQTTTAIITTEEVPADGWGNDGEGDEDAWGGFQ